MCKHSQDSIYLQDIMTSSLWVKSTMWKFHEISFVVPTWRTEGCTATVQQPASLQNTNETYANQAASLSRLELFSDTSRRNSVNFCETSKMFLKRIAVKTPEATGLYEHLSTPPLRQVLRCVGQKGRKSMER